MKPKPQGRPVGTTKDDSKRGVVRFRCHMRDKNRYVKAAQRLGLTLTEWIERKLKS